MKTMLAVIIVITVVYALFHRGHSNANYPHGRVRSRRDVNIYLVEHPRPVDLHPAPVRHHNRALALGTIPPPWPSAEGTPGQLRSGFGTRAEPD
jgi:hypothetical protein